MKVEATASTGAPARLSTKQWVIPIVLLNALSIAFVLGVIWVPEIWHYWVPTRDPSPSEIASSRTTPDNEVVREIGSMSFTGPRGTEPSADIALRGEIALRGRISGPGGTVISFDPQFDLRDFESGGSSDALQLAALVNVDLLLQAYEVTKREELFAAARDYVLRFASAERSLWLPHGLIWNDHAVAARSAVLARFWGHYRQRPDFSQDEARRFLSLVLGSGDRLASSKNFTVATNHGVMQNLALLQLSAAFSGLREASAWRDVAKARLAEQFGFYANREGVVLEHSAGYHRHGVILLTMAIRLLEMNGAAVPNEWSTKLTGARAFLGNLRRPDGSLPTFGDTDFATRATPEDFGRSCSENPNCGASLKPPEPGRALYPGAGYAIWWGGFDLWPQPESLSQTVVLWSYYPGHGHKLADEMSLLVWGKGQQWITNVGYWPYDSKDRDAATGWRNGNGPHLANEPALSDRETRLRGYALTDAAQVVDLERLLRLDQIRLRRQIVAVSGKFWLVLDSSEGNKTSAQETVWTFPPNLSLNRTGHSATLRGENVPGTMTVKVIGSEGLDVTDHRGSRDPFAGWVVQNGQPKPAPALVVRNQPSANWTLTAFAFSDKAQSGVFPEVDAGFVAPEEWHATLTSPEGDIRVSRNKDVIQITGFADRSLSIGLAPGASLATDRMEVDAAFASASAKYPKFRELLRYRTHVSVLVAVGMLLQEATLFLARRRSQRLGRALRLLAVPAWLGFGAWLGLIYLR